MLFDNFLPKLACNTGNIAATSICVIFRGRLPLLLLAIHFNLLGNCVHTLPSSVAFLFVYLILDGFYETVPVTALTYDLLQVCAHGGYCLRLSNVVFIEIGGVPHVGHQLPGFDRVDNGRLNVRHGVSESYRMHTCYSARLCGLGLCASFCIVQLSFQHEVFHLLGKLWRFSKDLLKHLLHENVELADGLRLNAGGSSGFHEEAHLPKEISSVEENTSVLSLLSRNLLLNSLLNELICIDNENLDDAPANDVELGSYVTLSDNPVFGQVYPCLELHANLAEERVIHPLEEGYALDDILVQEESQLPSQVAAHTPVVHQHYLVIVLLLVDPKVIVVSVHPILEVPRDLVVVALSLDPVKLHPEGGGSLVL
mmetsp:Transcript_8060/g.16277  ORF Transcript_8060/g.16277 Transcript_8060/m.16277 type:complete len:369 (-) Transcript_8060:1306-2412(-)